MLVLGDSTTWAAIGTSALAVVLLVVALLLVRWRRASARQLGSVQESTARTEDMFAELRQTFEQAQEQGERAREQADAAEREARRLRRLAEVSSTLDLDAVITRALETAADQTGADAAMLVLGHGDGEDPLIATYGLSTEESSRELIGLPPDVSQARAVTIRYRYTEDEIANDEFRLSGGLAVPVLAEDEERIGTLATFWRRVEREASEEELATLEDLAATFGPPLENARRFEAAERLADLDPLTSLQNARYYEQRLAREVARARRYERRLALLVFSFDAGPGGGALSLLATVGRRVSSAVRSADIACHLGDGRFAVILPEVGVEESEHLHRRLQFALGARLGGTTERLDLLAGIVELEAEDNAESLLRRAEAALASMHRAEEQELGAAETS